MMSQQQPEWTRGSWAQPREGAREGSARGLGLGAVLGTGVLGVGADEGVEGVSLSG